MGLSQGEKGGVLVFLNKLFQDLLGFVFLPGEAVNPGQAKQGLLLEEVVGMSRDLVQILNGLIKFSLGFMAGGNGYSGKRLIGTLVGCFV